MARSRNIKPKICKNKKLAKLSPHARILFRDIPMFADHEGRLIDDYETVHVEIFPYEHGLDVDSLLKELDDHDFIIRYKARPLPDEDQSESRFIWIPNFLKHQNPHKNERKNPSIIPVFNIETSFRVKDGTTLDNDGSDRAVSLNLIPDSLIPHSDSQENEIDPELLKPVDKSEFNNPDHVDPNMPISKPSVNPVEVSELCVLAIKKYKNTQYQSDVKPYITNFLATVGYKTLKKAIENASVSGREEHEYRPNFEKMFSSDDKVREIAERSKMTPQKLSKAERGVAPDFGPAFTDNKK